MYFMSMSVRKACCNLDDLHVAADHQVTAATREGDRCTARQARGEEIAIEVRVGLQQQTDP